MLEFGLPEQGGMEERRRKMKIAIISDTHLGTKAGTPRERDCFDQAREALSRALELGAGLVLIPGDIFDNKIPPQEVWAEAMDILSPALLKRNSPLELVETLDKNQEEISPVALQGTPIIALHGNHELRRGLNPVEALERAGFLIHLNYNTVVFNTPAGKVAIHGMSNVPERYAKHRFMTWNPKPLEGAFNILMLHQSLGQFMFSPEEAPALQLEDLPRDFDLYVCGHVHYHAETSIHGKPLLFPGSTERTQLLPVEAQVPKGFYLVDLDQGVKEFVELKTPRDFYYEEMEFEGVSPSQLEEAVKEKIKLLLNKPRRNPSKPPLIRLKLKGSLAQGAYGVDLDPEKLAKEFEEEALITLSKEELVAPGLREQIELVREMREGKRSIDEETMRLLEQSLRELGSTQMFDVRTLYHLLVEEKVEEAERRVFELIDSLVQSELGRRSRDN